VVATAEIAVVQNGLIVFYVTQLVLHQFELLSQLPRLFSLLNDLGTVNEVHNGPLFSRDVEGHPLLQ
jgi:hypothetical protein